MNDLYAETTRIVAALERGVALGPPWSTLAEAIPITRPDKRQYRRELHAVDPRSEATAALIACSPTARRSSWGQVRRGEHGTTVVFWKLKKRRVSPTAPRASRPGLPATAGLHVFNVAQVDDWLPN
jgi:antirestriction protein ArdC